MKWSFPGIDRPASAPVVSNGITYLAFKGRNQTNPNGPLESKIVAIESKFGRLLWSIPLEKTSEPMLAPLITSNTIYFTDGLELYTANPRTGSKRLIFKTEYDFVTKPILLDDETIYISSYKDFIAVKAETGEKQWSLRIPEGFISSTHISQGVAYISSIIDLNPHSAGKGYLVAIDLKTQKELWHFNFDGPIYSLFDDSDTIYFSSGLEIRGISKITGKEVWHFQAGRMINAPLLVNGVIYVGDLDGYLYAVPITENS